MTKVDRFEVVTEYAYLDPLKGNKDPEKNEVQRRYELTRVSTLKPLKIYRNQHVSIVLRSDWVVSCVPDIDSGMRVIHIKLKREEEDWLDVLLAQNMLLIHWAPHTD